MRLEETTFGKVVAEGDAWQPLEGPLLAKHSFGTDLYTKFGNDPTNPLIPHLHITLS